MNGVSRALLRAYPPSFRERYGAELTGLVEDLPASRTGAADLARGAALAWVRPRFTGPDARPRRLRATAATTWLAWCAGFLIAPAVSRGLLDPVQPRVTSGVRALLDAGYVLFFVGWAAALAGAAPLVLRGLVPALRGRQWAALRPLLPALGLGSLQAAGLAWLAITRPAVQDPLPVGVAVLAAVWVIAALLFVIALGVGPAVALRRIATPLPSLQVAAVLSAAVAVSLAGLTACAAAAAVQAGDAQLFNSAAPVIAGLVVAGLASVTALVSAARGVRLAWRA